jgi:hypothetical protein
VRSWTPIPDLLPELVEDGAELLGLVRLLRDSRIRGWKPEAMTDRRLAGVCQCSKRRARQLLEDLEDAEVLRTVEPGNRNRARIIQWTVQPATPVQRAATATRTRTKKWTSPGPTNGADFNDIAANPNQSRTKTRTTYKRE